MLISIVTMSAITLSVTLLAVAVLLAVAALLLAVAALAALAALPVERAREHRTLRVVDLTEAIRRSID